MSSSDMLLTQPISGKGGRWEETEEQVQPRELFTYQWEHWYLISNLYSLMSFSIILLFLCIYKAYKCYHSNNVSYNKIESIYYLIMYITSIHWLALKYSHLIKVQNAPASNMSCNIENYSKAIQNVIFIPKKS